MTALVDITLRVTDHHANLIAEIIGKDGQELKRVTVKPQSTRYQGGKRFKRIPGHELVNELCKTRGPITREQIRQGFEEEGEWKGNSFSACITRAVEAGLITRIGELHFSTEVLRKALEEGARR